MVVSPGFIDMHSHSDVHLLINPLAESKIRQGVTTEVTGNCGSSPAPITKENFELFKRRYGPLAEEIPWDWRTFGEYLDKLQGNGVAVNVAPLQGHGTIRIAVMGYDNRQPTSTEMERMQDLVAEGMKAGAFGLSTGLIYPPSCYAETQELIELCRVVARFGGYYSSHIRGEGRTLIDAVKEAITIGERAGVPVEISHRKAWGRDNWGKVKETLKLIEEAQYRGVDVTCDVYPYTASSTGLGASISPWAHEGGIEKMLERLKDPEIRLRLKREMEAQDQAGWDKVLIAQCEENKDYVGKTIQETAQSRGMDPYDFVFNFLIEEKGSVATVSFAMHPEDVAMVIGHPVSMIGSDGYSLTPYGVLGKGKPHPRSYGTFPRVLAKYVREEGVLSLEESIYKMTGLPARKLGLKDRGIIAEEACGDLVIFDPSEVEDAATFQEPHQYPKGIKYVMVNGQIVVEEGEHTRAKPGKVLRKRATMLKRCLQESIV